MKKTSKAYFHRFKKAFLYWQKRLGLTQYRISFTNKYHPDDYAEITIMQLGKCATVLLTTELTGPSADSILNPEDHAKHEAIHLLLSRLTWLGQSRYIEQNDLSEEEEAVVVRLENVLEQEQ